jgi:hypothetical protein
MPTPFVVLRVRVQIKFKRSDGTKQIGTIIKKRTASVDVVWTRENITFCRTVPAQEIQLFERNSWLKTFYRTISHYITLKIALIVFLILILLNSFLNNYLDLLNSQEVWNNSSILYRFIFLTEKKATLYEVRISAEIIILRTLKKLSFLLTRHSNWTY